MAHTAGFLPGTFSVVGRCARTGQLGIGTCTAALAVGAFVPHAQAHLGAVATQAFTNPYLGIEALRRLAAGQTPEEVVEEVLAGDVGREMRQLGVVDAQGRSAARSGRDLEPWVGHVAGESFAVVGNTLAGPEVIQAMAGTFLESPAKPLAERLVRALEAGQEAGGDKRGRQSAVLYVVWDEEYGYVDLRVDDHVEPIAELRRLWHLYKAQLEPVMGLFPTKNRPEGELDRSVWERAGSE